MYTCICAIRLLIFLCGNFIIEEEKLQAATQASCYTWCKDGGNGGGVIIGTAPSCGGSCEEDCSGHTCTAWPANCWSGHKVCCCCKFASNLH
jgi:hypothetical protein